ncbi:MAG TPA: STAS domain-containing protein [Mycobacteriales bacterium]
MRDLDNPRADSSTAISPGARMLRLSTSHDSNQSWVEASGELDMFTAPMLDEAINRLRQDGFGRAVILDLRHLTFMDCAGLSVLVRHHAGLHADGGRLLLLHPSRPVARLLTLTGMDSELHIR